MAGIAALLIAPVFVGAQPASAASPVYKQHAANKIGSGTVNSLAFGTANTAGSLIVANVVWNNTGTVSITDTRNTYAPVAPATKFSNNQWSSQVFYAKSVGAGANTVTATFGTAINEWAMLYVHEYAGVDKVSPLDAFNSAVGSGSAMNSGPATLSGSNDLIFAAGASNSSVTAAGTGFATRSTLSGDRTMDKVVTSAGAHDATATQSGSVWVLHMVAFKADSGSTPPPGDTTPAARSNGAPAGTLPASTTSTTLSLVTSESATCKHATAAGTAYGAMPGTFGTTNNLNHSATVSGLVAGQSYTYYARCQDNAGNVNPDDYPISFSIAASQPPPSGFNYERVVVDPSTEPEPWMKGIGDLNGDGVADLIVAGRHGRVVWYQTPNWTERVIAQSASSQSGSAVGDVDGDGDIDVVVGATWHENVGNATSWVAHNLPNGAYGMTHDIVIADVNGDGKQDVSMRGESNSTVHVYLQTNPTTWTKFTVDPGLGLNGLDVADVNADGRRDLVVGGKWMENPGGAVATTPWPARAFASSWLGYAAVKVVNINGGRMDIVLSVSEEVGKLSWFEQHDNGSWSEHVVDNGLNSVHGLIVEDIDHDGLRDIVASEYNGQGRFTIYRQVRDTAGAVTWQHNLIGTDRLHNVQAADLNGDGKLDFFGAYSLTASTPALVYRSAG